MVAWVELGNQRVHVHTPLTVYDLMNLGCDSGASSALHMTLMPHMQVVANQRTVGGHLLPRSDLVRLRYR